MSAEHLGALAFAALGLIIWALAVTKLEAPYGPPYWQHHVWVGVALVLTPWWPLWLVGVLLVWDDAWQHSVQIDTRSYTSPVHRVWEWLYRVAHR